jgi:transcriptional regulator with XRE-family HTH domain
LGIPADTLGFVSVTQSLHGHTKMTTDLPEKAGIGVRLRAERERLGLGQLDLSEAGGVNRNTQGAYEKGERAPDASYLAAAARLGVDVLFVVTGVRAQMADLSPEQSRLLDYFSAADDDAQRAAMLVLEALARLEPGSRQPQPPTPAPPQRNWEVRPDFDLALWRSVALSLPGSANAGNAALTPQQWLDVVNDVYESAKNDKTARAEAERGARSALARAQKK